MPIATHTGRRTSGIYYMRFRVPKDLIPTVGKPQILYSLRTKDAREAKRLSFLHSYEMECYFNDLRHSLRNNTPVPQRDFTVIPNGIDAAPVRTTVQTVPSSSDARPTPKTPKKMFPFSDIWERYKNESRLSVGSIADFRTHITRFIAYLGDRDISEYTKEDIRRYKDLMLEFPAYVYNLNEIKDFDKFVEDKKRKNPNYRRIAITTVKHKCVGVIKSVFAYAYENGYIAINPADSITVLERKQTSSSSKRLPFSDNELSAIFSSSFYASKEKYRGLMKEDRRDYQLLVLMGLLTGARLQEIARLELSDIGQENGIYYAYIHGEEGTSRTVKTASSVRRIPLHSKLLDFGFAEYIQRLKAKGRRYLFPTLFDRKEIRGNVGHYFSKWFARFLNRLLITDASKCFHSFRHTLKRKMRNAGIPPQIYDAYQGHSTKDVSSSYGRDEFNMGYSLEVLSEYLERIKFDKINFAPFSLLE